VSKAFDRVNHDIFFSNLMERGIPGPPILNHFLLSWYKSQRMQVRRNATLSPAFSVSNGVWQGGVLSPILFTIYMSLGLKVVAAVDSRVLGGLKQGDMQHSMFQPR